MHAPPNISGLTVPHRTALPFIRRKTPPPFPSPVPFPTVSYPTLSSATTAAPKRGAPTGLRLTDLPDDLLSRILTTLMSPVAIGPHSRIVESCFQAALPLSQTCRRLHTLFHAQLHDLELWQTGRLTDRGLRALTHYAGTAVRRLVLRNCSRLSIRTVTMAVGECSQLRALDLSHLCTLNDMGLNEVLRRAPGVSTLLLRGCVRLGDAALHAVAMLLPKLEMLDVGGCSRVTDSGIVDVARVAGATLGMVVVSDCARLTDVSLEALGRWCGKLQVVTARRLGGVSDVGITSLCRGVGTRLSVLDVLDCPRLSGTGVLSAARRYCPILATRLAKGRGRDGTGDLRQMVIASLSGLIFHVTGSDVRNGKAAVYFLLVDCGTSNSFRVSVGSSSLDLTNYGSILASCFGEAPNEHVKRTLLNMYGLDLHQHSDERRGT